MMRIFRIWFWLIIMWFGLFIMWCRFLIMIFRFFIMRSRFFVMRLRFYFRMWFRSPKPFWYVVVVVVCRSNRRLNES